MRQKKINKNKSSLSQLIQLARLDQKGAAKRQFISIQ